MKKIIIFIAIAIPIFCFGGELFPNEAPRYFSIADRLEQDATIGGYPIWNGEGKWRIYDLVQTSSGGAATSLPLGTVRLFQTEGKNWVASMDVFSNLRRGKNYWIDVPCKRDDMLFKLELIRGTEDNCLTINHIVGFMSNPRGRGSELYALLKEQGIEYPPTVLEVKFTRQGTAGKMLIYTLWINPELAGFAREIEPNWGRNPWHKSMAFRDPNKKQFIDKLAAWGTNFLQRMDDGLSQRQTAYTNIPSWRSVIDVNDKPIEIKRPVALD